MQLELSDRVVDLDTGEVSGGTALTQFECTVLRYLLAAGGAPVSRDQLLVEVWGYPKPVATRAVDTCVRRLRRKLEGEPTRPRHLLTVQGVGYRWVGGSSPDPSSAVQALLEQAPGLIRAGALDEVARRAHQCLDATLPVREQLEVRLVLVNAYRGLGLLGSAREAADVALELSRRSAPDQLGACLGRKALVAHTEGHFDEALTLYQQAAERYRGVDDGEAAMYLSELAQVKWTLARPDALETAQQAYRMARHAELLGDSHHARSIRRRADRALCSILVGLGRGHEAVSRLEALIAEEPVLVTSLLRVSGTSALIEAGELDAALRWAEQAIDAARQVGELPQLGMACQALAVVRWFRGDLDGSSAAHWESVRHFEDAGSPARTVVPRCWLAVAALRQGQSDKARQILEVADQLPHSSPGLRAVVALAWRALGEAREVPEARHQPYVRLAERAFA